MAKRIITTFLFVCALATSAMAGELPYGLDAYAGAFGGWGASRELYNAPRTDTRIDHNTGSAFGGGYAGIGWDFLAVEAGWFKLPGYHSSVTVENPDRHANQTIDGSAIFVRGLIRGPADWYARPYLFMGAAHVKASSREVGQCPTCGAGYVPDFRVDMRTTAPYIGGGFEFPLFSHVAARGEVGYIPRAVNSWWASNRDYYMGSIALQVRF